MPGQSLHEYQDTLGLFQKLSACGRYIGSRYIQIALCPHKGRGTLKPSDGCQEACPMWMVVVRKLSDNTFSFRCRCILIYSGPFWDIHKKQMYDVYTDLFESINCTEWRKRQSFRPEGGNIERTDKEVGGIWANKV